MLTLLLIAMKTFSQSGGPPILTTDPGTPENNHWEINTAIGFQFTEELVLTITCTGQGYVGIRHAAYAGRYVLGNYSHITEYRAILSEFGYNIAPEAWLGTKDFKEYEGEESTVVSNIIREIETIKKRM